MPQGLAFKVNTSGIANVSDISAAMDNQGGFMITYHSYSQIYAQRFDNFGNPQGSEILVSQSSGSRGNSAIAYNAGKNEYAIVWYDGSLEADEGIYARRFTAQGVAVDATGFRVPASLRSSFCCY
jgi:hypothetical protein